MYVKSLKLIDINSFHHLEWSLEGESLAGWHVVVGDNASGKTTFLRSMALHLLDRRIFDSLRFHTGSLVRQGIDGMGVITSSILYDGSIGRFEHSDEEDHVIGEVQYALMFRPTASSVGSGDSYHERVGQWFSASIGPMRRFSGGDKSHDRLFTEQPRLAAHLSLFGEDVALTEIERWLKDMQFEKLEGGGGLHWVELGWAGLAAGLGWLGGWLAG